MLDQAMVDKMTLDEVTKSLDVVARGLSVASSLELSDAKPKLLAIAKQLIARKGALVNGPDRIRRHLPARP